MPRMGSEANSMVDKSCLCLLQTGINALHISWPILGKMHTCKHCRTTERAAN